jgi:hypothetical protein
MDRSVLDPTLLALAAAAGGCRAHTPVDNAASEYAEGDYEDALGELERAELAYADGRLEPEYELKYLAYRGLASYRIYKKDADKGARRRARPFVRRALERWNGVPAAKAEGWLDAAIVKELEEAGRDLALGPPGENGPPDEADR